MNIFKVIRRNFIKNSIDEIFGTVTELSNKLNEETGKDKSYQSAKDEQKEIEQRYNIDVKLNGENNE